MAKSKSKAAAKTTKPTGTPAKAKQTLFERKSRQFHIGSTIRLLVSVYVRTHRVLV